jgi:hypothetical protein
MLRKPNRLTLLDSLSPPAEAFAFRHTPPRQEPKPMPLVTITLAKREPATSPEKKAQRQQKREVKARIKEVKAEEKAVKKKATRKKEVKQMVKAIGKYRIDELDDALKRRLTGTGNAASDAMKYTISGGVTEMEHRNSGVTVSENVSGDA